MLAKKKEKDVIDRMLDQIDFHGMTAEELNKSSMTSRLLTEIFIAQRLKQNLQKTVYFNKRYINFLIYK